MSKHVKKIRSIPAPGFATGVQRQFFEALREVIQVGEGDRGDPLDRKLTVRDLVEIGQIKLKRSGIRSGTPILEPSQPAPDLSVPPVASGVLTTKGIGVVYVSWDQPYEQYSNHAHAKIYRATENNFANAVFLSTVSGTVYADPTDFVYDDNTGEVKGYYYWVSFVSAAGVEGPPHSINGIYGEPAADPDHLIHLLENKITATQLHQDLTSRIDQYGTQIQQVEQSVQGLSASWVLKTDVNGRVAGIGLANDGNTSSFQILSDQFAVLDPDDPATVVIGTLNGVAVINGAYMGEATIKSAAIQSMSVEKLIGNTADFVQANITNGSITIAKIAQEIYSSGYSSSSPGWYLNKNGTFILRGAGGQIIMSTFGGIDIDASDVSGLGDLATQDNVDHSDVSGLGSFATLNEIHGGNAGVYIRNGAFDTLLLAGNAITVKQTLSTSAALTIPKGGKVLVLTMGVYYGSVAPQAVSVVSLATIWANSGGQTATFMWLEHVDSGEQALVSGLTHGDSIQIMNMHTFKNVSAGWNTFKMYLSQEAVGGSFRTGNCVIEADGAKR